jgi:tetratricopeptide (TPR) repeat protein
MSWRYALFLGLIAGLAATLFVERATVGAIAQELGVRTGAALDWAGEALGRWWRDENTSDGSAQMDLPTGAEAGPRPDGAPQPEPSPPAAPAPPPGHPVLGAGAGDAAGASAGLDGLFAALRRSATAEDAARIEADIFLQLSRARSATVNLMMNSAAVRAEQDGLAALQPVYAHVTQLEPDYAEGWARLAAAQFEAGNLDQATAALRTAVRLEPRHYAAWTGLGAVLESQGDMAEAAVAYREALWLNPWQDAARRGLLRAETISQGLPM